ncbi:MAG: hypothetical protein Q9219_000594 [cf. Caloplaca sp. 3 TL-2023]
MAWGKDDFHVLLNIRCTLFERENFLNERLREWSFGIYHAKPQLDECVPDYIRNAFTSATVDPVRGLNEHDVLPMFNVQTGELLMSMPTPNAIRLHRSSTLVTANFEDGSAVTGDLLIGTDGANSKVREFLLGPPRAALTPLPLLGSMAVESMPADLARKMRDINPLYNVGYHPEGVCTYMSINDVPDPSRPGTWKWMFSLTWPDKDSSVPDDVDTKKQQWLSWAEKLAEPFRSAYLAIVPNANIWCNRLAEWRTEPWDNRSGRVTLAGDAAHPMTYHRGQGLNNAILDAAFLCQSLNEHHQRGKPIKETLATYEKEMQERGRAAVISSGENSLMVHDWEQLKQSPVFTLGLKPLQKVS